MDKRVEGQLCKVGGRRHWWLESVLFSILLVKLVPSIIEV